MHAFEIFRGLEGNDLHDFGSLCERELDEAELVLDGIDEIVVFGIDFPFRGDLEIVWSSE